MNEITITINPENLNPNDGETYVETAIYWAKTELEKAADMVNAARERYARVAPKWDAAACPSPELKAEYEAIVKECNMADAREQELTNLLKTLRTLKLNLLHLSWTMDPDNY